MSHPNSRPLAQRWVILLAGLLALPLLIATPKPAAHAASFDGMLDFGGYHVGAFLSSNGARVYCLEPGAEAPVSTQRAPTRVSTLPDYTVQVNDAWGWRGTVHTSAASGEKLRQINWVLAEHGKNAGPERAVAVQIALWELRREPGNAAWLDGKYALFAQHGGGGHVAAGKQLAAEAKTSAKGPGQVRPHGTLTLDITSDDGDGHGGGTVSYPAGTTGLTITGGTFADGTQQALIAEQSGGTLDWVAVPHEPEWQRTAEVTLAGSWSMRETYWPAEVVLHPATREVEQRIGAGVEPVVGANVGDFEPVRTRFETSFTPHLATQVPSEPVSREAGVFADTVTVTPVGAPWPTRGEGGEHLPLLAAGTLYGPFDAPQPESDVAPEGAPVAGNTELFLEQGPGTYTAELQLSDVQSGYYYWLWEIREEQQSAAVRASGILDPGSSYADRFAVLSERQFLASELRWETRLARTRLTAADRSLDDQIRVETVGGAWMRDDAGERIPATLRLTYYHTDEQPVRQPEVPEGARELGSATVQVADADRWTPSPRFEVPGSLRGWVSVRACLVEADQPPAHVGKLAPWCDDFGVPAETARIVEELAVTGGAGQVTTAPRVSWAPGAAALIGSGALLAGLMVLRRRRELAAHPGG